jgi:tetratricopeptide (TPR) repeat protein
VREVIGQRLDPLSEACNQALAVASVIGREFTLELLGRLVEETSAGRLLEVMEEALTARVIEELPQAVGRYRFTHALIQETLMEELSIIRRVRLHAHISEVMEQVYGNDSQEHAAEIAHHLAEAVTMTGAERLVHYSLLAGERALATHEYDEALAHFQRAVDARQKQGSTGSGQDLDAEMAAIMFGLGRAQLATLERHQMREAVASLSRALDYYVQYRDVPRAVAVGEYSLPPLPGQRVGLTQLVARALAMIPPDSREAGGLLSRYGQVIGIEEADYEGAKEIAGQALAIAQREGDLHLEMRTLAESAYVDIFHLHFQECLEKSQRAIELARRLDEPAAEMHGHIHAATSLMLMGDREGARLHAAGGLALAERLRDRFWLSTALLVNLAVSAFTVTG